MYVDDNRPLPPPLPVSHYQRVGATTAEGELQQRVVSIVSRLTEAEKNSEHTSEGVGQHDGREGGEKRSHESVANMPLANGGEHCRWYIVHGELDGG